MNHNIMELDLGNFTLLDGFWKDRNQLLVDAILPYQWDTLNNRTEGVPLSHAVENFRIAAKESQGVPKGTIFQDSDVAKWIEAASYSLFFQENEALQQIIDELVRLIVKSQHKNGYVNTFYTAKGIEKRWTDLEMGHELYCAGHLIEAAVAYYTATGKKTFLDSMILFATLLKQEFGPEEGKLHAFDGHPEIEIALYRLAEVTGDRSYSDLADYFMNIRGTLSTEYRKSSEPDSYARWLSDDYFLAHQPVREMREVTGHAVRAMYLYAGMADMYRSNGDPTLWEALTALWDSFEKKHLYLTGGIGSQNVGERFTVAYDLPPERGYTETCASIGAIFWAWRMALIDPDSRYADMVEREFYNGALSGISLDGKSYFYVNPLEMNPRIATARQDMEHVLPHRVGWFDCACCPTNIARLIGSLGNYIYSTNDTNLYIHQYVSSEARLSLADKPITVLQKTTYPWSGVVSISLDMEDDTPCNVFLRIPGWCDQWSVAVNTELQDDYRIESGYVVLKRVYSPHDTIRLTLQMPVKLVQSDSRVEQLSGKAAIMRGPLVYCLEEKDNGSNLHELVLDSNSEFDLKEESIESVPVVSILMDGYRETIRPDALYQTYQSHKRERIRIAAIPYFCWGNRSKDQEMRVWNRVM